MADDRFPNDPYRPNLADDEYLRAARRDGDLQVDPELGEGPASSGKVALFAVAVALVLGAVFYGLNNTSTGNQASNYACDADRAADGSGQSGRASRHA